MKKWQMMRLGLGVMLGILAGCPATVGTGSGVYVPKDSAAQCAEQCQHTGMVLGSVVVMANNVGCVCTPPSTAATACTNAAGGGAAGGLAALMAAQQADESAQRSAASTKR